MRVATGLLAALLLGTCSCAGNSGAIEKELGEVRSELVKLRAQNAILTDRLDSMEAAARHLPAARPAPPEDADRPSLEVVRLGPEPANAPAEAKRDRPSPQESQDGTPAEPAADSASGSRPVIRLTGKAGAGAQTSPKKNLKPNAEP